MLFSSLTSWLNSDLISTGTLEYFEKSKNLLTYSLEFSDEDLLYSRFKLRISSGEIKSFISDVIGKSSLLVDSFIVPTLECSFLYVSSEVAI